MLQKAELKEKEISYRQEKLDFYEQKSIEYIFEIRKKQTI